MSKADCLRSPNFDRIARLYRLMEHFTFGRALTRTRTAHLASVTLCQNALVLGDGDGRALATLLRLNPGLFATAIDSSGAMLRLLADRCAFARDRLIIVHADARAVLAGHTPAAAPFDLVTTHFFLDCFADVQLAALVPAIRTQLSPGALWVVSEFRIPPSGLLRLPARLLVRGLYLAFRLFTGLESTRLPDFTSLLEKAGFERIRTTHSLGGLLTAQLWKLRSSPSLQESPVN